MASRLEKITARPAWVAFAVLIVAVSIYQWTLGSTTSALFGVAVAVVLLLSLAFQPEGPRGGT